MLYSLEVGNLEGLVAILFAIMLGPPIVLVIFGLIARNTYAKKKLGNFLFIIAGVYLLVGLGLCGQLV